MKVLDRCWKNCLRMWKWLSENLPEGFSESSNPMKEFVINGLKRQWLWKNKFTSPLQNDCFFCEYDKKHGDACGRCPAGLVKGGFHCADYNYHFAHDPVAFYQRIARLNPKRKVG